MADSAWVTDPGGMADSGGIAGGLRRGAESSGFEAGLTSWDA
ncbi:hypothetical protein HMPREF9004_1781 [Schaalia cardiffensis F0333]|uniref:Uncharacterized protein n=1 Tax=Schaalia cardiffensis F0333 TaxID=888050 RepID=N6X0Z6_9ACTO|nr:hypothetical protein HMPREF9004_1781 [Schaalia cardiffensis F0333]